MVFVLQSLKLNHIGRVHETGSFLCDFVLSVSLLVGTFFLGEDFLKRVAFGSLCNDDTEQHCTCATLFGTSL